MDSRLETALMSLVLGAGMALSTLAVAQSEDPAAATGETGTRIFGTRELPKGLTIVPWKKSQPGKLSETPTRLVDEPLEPIDPDVFQRRLEYYEQSRGQ